VKKSDLEENLFNQILLYGIPVPEREYRFCERRWKFDFAWPNSKIAIEVEGAIFVDGRHSRGLGMIKDMDKYNRAALLNWKVFRFSGNHVKDGSAIVFIDGLFNQPNP